MVAIILNITIYCLEYRTKLPISSLFEAGFNLLFTYLTTFLIFKILLDNFQEEILRKAVEYLQEIKYLEKSQFSIGVWNEISNKFSSYILIGLLILDRLGFINFSFRFMNTFTTINMIVTQGTE